MLPKLIHKTIAPIKRVGQKTAQAIKGNYLRTRNANARAHFELLNPGKAGKSSAGRTALVAKITHPNMKGYTTMRDNVQTIKHKRHAETRKLREDRAIKNAKGIPTQTQQNKLLKSATEKLDFVQNLKSTGAMEEVMEFAGHLRETQRTVNLLKRDPEELLAWFGRTIMVDKINQLLKNHGKESLTKEELRVLFYQGIKK